MVFESLINPVEASKSLPKIFIVGFIYSTLAVFLSLVVFKSYASLVMIFLTALACVPWIHSVIKLEEKKAMELTSEYLLFAEHKKIFTVFIVLFIGFVSAFTVWYVFLPTHLVELLFLSQSETINNINGVVTGNVISTSEIFLKIVLNNLRVLFFCMVFAFFYGAGAIFILAWNASVISAAIGNYVRNSLSSSYFEIFSLATMRYAIHGLPEILAYFIIGLAGSIISVAIIRHDYKSTEFKRIILDSADLILISVVLIFVAAMLEVFVTPIFFTDI